MRTAFNLLGPLTNPARPGAQIVGVPRPELTGFLARCLARLGVSRAWVVHGAGLDELTLAGATSVAEVRGSEVRSFTVTPEDAGLRLAEPQALQGGDAVRNAEIAREVLAGAPGPRRDVVLLNAAAALVVAEEVDGPGGGSGPGRSGDRRRTRGGRPRAGPGDRVMGELGVLGEIVARTRERVRERKAAVPLEQLLASAPPATSHRAFGHALSRVSVNVIAEFKRRSPSRGLIREDLAPDDLAVAYETAGAAALSVLTEGDYFAGSLEDLGRARSATLLPVLRKDFVVDPYQVWEAAIRRRRRRAPDRRRPLGCRAALPLRDRGGCRPRDPGRSPRP